MKKGPFKLKSGNSPMYKELGSSPAKKYVSDAQRKAVHASKAERSPAKKTYREAYATLTPGQAGKYKDYEAFEKAAKAYNVKKYGTTEPTREAKKLIPGYSDVKDVKSGKKKLEQITKYKETKKAADKVAEKKHEERGKTMTREARNKTMREADKKLEESLKTRKGRKTAKKALKESKKSLKQKKREGTISKKEYEVAREGIKVGKKKVRKAARKAIFGKVGKFLKEKVVKLK